MGSRKLKILEIGCATGNYLYFLKKIANYDVTGVELNPSAAKYARENYALNVIAGTLFDGKFENCTFDVVIMRHVLEHVYNPSETVSEIKRILNPGGIFFFTVPNSQCIEAGIFKKYWHGWDIPRHLYHFDRESITRLLEKNKFQDILITYQFIPNDWIWSFQHFFKIKGYRKVAKLAFNTENVPLLLVFLPAGLIARLVRKSGRLRIVAKKNL